MPPRSDFEEVLLTVLWGAETYLCPTFSRLGESFEAWEFRHGLNRRVERVAARALVQREQRARELVWRLTATGRRQVMGGMDPERRWERPWDGIWRQIMFDLPAREHKLRLRLWRWLRAQRFGYLQRSVWVSPDPVPELGAALEEFREDVESFVVMEARCAAGFRDAAIVTGAWDFAEINRRYRGYLSQCALDAAQGRKLRGDPAGLQAWLRMERQAWNHAFRMDPLLPRALWLDGYAGAEAYAVRKRSLGLIARAILGVA